jgi:hypothetical protein
MSVQFIIKLYIMHVHLLMFIYVYVDRVSVCILDHVRKCFDFIGLEIMCGCSIKM